MPEPDPPSNPSDAPSLGTSSVSIFFQQTLPYQVESEDRPSALPRDLLASSPSRYTSLAELGQGGFATVYLVQDHQLDRTVALKLLRLSNRDAGAGRRFREEAQATAQLEHPNIVPVYDVGEMDGVPFYTMKYVRGRSLASVLAMLRHGEPGPVREYSLARLVQSVIQVAMAASYAHEKGVVHRDLKPGNVMLGSFGEVLVMDWGLSRALAAAKGGRRVVGTPAYMAPEQALGLTERIDPRTDVHALGVMLYEVLALRRPFEGATLGELLRRIAEDPAVRPSVLAPDRDVPPQLELAALRALAKAMDDRQPSARAFHDELQAWLEAESDRRRREVLATEAARQARDRLDGYRKLVREARARELDARDERARFRGAEPLAEKGSLIRAEERVKEARRDLVHASSQVVASLTAALAYEPAHTEATELMAEYCWTRLVESERQGDADGVAFFAELIGRYDDGRFADRVRGDGSLSLETEPAGAQATLYRFVEDGFVLRAERVRDLGKTPIEGLPLAMGSWLVVLRTESGAVRYPLRLDRGGAWSGRVRMDRAVPPGFTLVPAGPFRCGPAPGAVVHVDDFALAVHPVTLGEYVDFLDALAARDRDEALQRAPRLAAGERSYLDLDGGRFALGPLAPQAVPWSPAWPVFGVSWHDARAYAAWRSELDGRTYGLPTSLEWEKAARGVDGRRYPWGERFDPALANMKRSLDPPPRPAAVGSFPLDESPYGVFGLGGNVRDWCADVAEEGDETRDERVVRGGAWCLGALCADTWSAGGLASAAPSPYVGFRLVWRP